MAGDWIKVQVCTPDKPEVYRIAEDLGIDPDAVTGKLIRIWCWADQQTVDGNAPSVTKSLLDRVTGVTGFTDSLVGVGWLVKTDAGYIFPNFSRHNGCTAKTRALGAKRAENLRESRKRNGDSVTKRALNAQQTRSDSVTREEKKREEKNVVLSTQAADAVADVPEESGTKARWVAQCVGAATGTNYRVTPKRQKAIAARFRDPYWVDNWQEALSRCGSISGLNGNNDTNWTFDLDWFIRPETVVKIMEGKYDTWGTQRRQLTKAEQREQANADAFAIFNAQVAASSFGSFGIAGDPSATLFLEEHGSTDSASG